MLADADLQKQLTANETAYNTAVTKANAAYDSAIISAESTRTAALKTASAQRTTALAQITKTKDSAVAQSERVYDQVVAALDAHYGSSSSNGDTGLEGARRDAAISKRDAQYYATRDTFWARALNSSTSLGPSLWIIKERITATAQAVYSSSHATAQAAHDAALLSAIDNWQTSNRASTLALLLAEGQSREAYNNATATVYANWETGVGNLLGVKPEGTGYVPVRGYEEGVVGAIGGATPGNATRFEKDDEESTDSGIKRDEATTTRPMSPTSEGPLLWITPQQMLELERQHGKEMMDRLKSFYRIRDPNIGVLPRDLLNSLSQDSISLASCDVNLNRYTGNQIQTNTSKTKMYSGKVPYDLFHRLRLEGLIRDKQTQMGNVVDKAYLIEAEAMAIATSLLSDDRWRRASMTKSFCCAITRDAIGCGDIPMSAAKDDEMIETFLLDRLHESFGEFDPIGRSDRISLGFSLVPVGCNE